MKEFDNEATKKMEALLGIVAESEGFDSADDELSAEDLDNVTGGVAMPSFQQFMQYVRDRDEKEGKHG